MMMQFSKHLAVVFLLFTLVAPASEDTDSNPKCPYVLEAGENCTDKSLKMLAIERELAKQERSVITQTYQSANVPEPNQAAYFVIAAIAWLAIWRIRR